MYTVAFIVMSVTVPEFKNTFTETASVVFHIVLQAFLMAAFNSVALLLSQVEEWTVLIGCPLQL